MFNSDALGITRPVEIAESAPVGLTYQEQAQALELAGFLIGKTVDLGKLIHEPKGLGGKCISSGLKTALAHAPRRLKEKFDLLDILEPSNLDIASVMVDLWGRMARVDIAVDDHVRSPHKQIAFDIAAREETLESFPLVGVVVRDFRMAVLNFIPPNTKRAVLREALILALPEIQRILRIKLV